MDNAGFWRAPEEWPEDDPPLPGWTRNASGRWSAPGGTQGDVDAVDTRWKRTSTTVAVIDEPEAPVTKRSRQARADRRAMFLVAGAIGAALLLLVGAMVLITQAGAAPDPDNPEIAGPSVIYAAETEQDFLARRVEAAALRPERARGQLALLAVPPAVPDPAPIFDAGEWTVADSGCLDLTERVLIARSAIDVSFADTLDCVPASGSWTDPYQGTTIRRTIDADVVHHVAPELVWAAGGFEWTAETRQAYLVDLEHPAVHQVVAAEAGHNPRSQGPSDWKPANTDAWCAYAVDWIEVLHRWNLGVSDDDRSALDTMLDTCASATTRGANPRTTTLDDPALPSITLRTE